MKVYISYSLSLKEQYILTILAKKLKEQGYVVSTSYGLENLINNFWITSANLFIGIVTDSGSSYENVLKEWNLAISKKMPALLMVEKDLLLNNNYLGNSNVIVFDRNRPDPSIELVRKKIEASRKPVESNDQKAWILGGLAVLALIGLLSNDDD